MRNFLDRSVDGIEPPLSFVTARHVHSRMSFESNDPNEHAGLNSILQRRVKLARLLRKPRQESRPALSTRLTHPKLSVRCQLLNQSIPSFHSLSLLPVAFGRGKMTPISIPCSYLTLSHPSGRALNLSRLGTLDNSTSNWTSTSRYAPSPKGYAIKLSMFLL